MGNFAENLNLGNRFRPPCNKLYVSKLPRAFVFGARLIQENSSFYLFFFLAYFFFQFFCVGVCVGWCVCVCVCVLWAYLSKYRWKDNRHNKTLWTTDFLNSVFCLVTCSSKNQVPYFILIKVVTNSNLKRLLLKKKKKKKKHALRSGFSICHKLWDIEFFSLA